MSISQSDLDSFHHFASHELSQRGAGLSLEDLLDKWRAEREHAETIASIRRGVKDANAGRMHDLADVDTKIRTELGFPARRR